MGGWKKRKNARAPSRSQAMRRQTRRQSLSALMARPDPNAAISWLLSGEGLPPDRHNENQPFVLIQFLTRFYHNKEFLYRSKMSNLYVIFITYIKHPRRILKHVVAFLAKPKRHDLSSFTNLFKLGRAVQV